MIVTLLGPIFFMLAGEQVAEFVANGDGRAVAGGEDDEGKMFLWEDVEACAHAGGAADVTNEWSVVDVVEGHSRAAIENEPGMGWI